MHQGAEATSCVARPRNRVSRFILLQNLLARAPSQTVPIIMNFCLLASETLPSCGHPCRSARPLPRIAFRGADQQQLICRRSQRRCPRAAPGRSGVVTQATAASENGSSTVRMSVQVSSTDIMACCTCGICHPALVTAYNSFGAAN